MRSCFLIILSCSFLNASTELHQLFKLPFLLAHYRHHRAEDKSLTLVEFFKIHYSGDHPADNDDEEDGQLPFKSAGNIYHLENMTDIFRESSERLIAPLSRNFSNHFREAIPSRTSFSIFHPPRLS